MLVRGRRAQSEVVETKQKSAPVEETKKETIDKTNKVTPLVVSKEIPSTRKATVAPPPVVEKKTRNSSKKKQSRR